LSGELGMQSAYYYEKSVESTTAFFKIRFAVSSALV